MLYPSQQFTSRHRSISIHFGHCSSIEKCRIVGLSMKQTIQLLSAIGDPQVMEPPETRYNPIP